MPTWPCGCEDLRYPVRREATLKISKDPWPFFIASKWLDYLLNDRDKVYFYILGINLNRLDKSYFGQQKQQNNIYNRFFRTSILKSVKSYFHPYEKIYIKKICHDSSTSLETDAYLSWHCIFYIDNRDDKIYFKTDKIDFIDSDHRKSSNDYSHFIQFIDLLLGCVYNCIEYASKNPDKEAIAEKCLPLVERLIEKPNNKNSRYNYVGRQKIEFFPKHDLRGLDRDSLEYKFKKRDSFYYKRVLKIKNKDQMTLL